MKRRLKKKKNDSDLFSLIDTGFNKEVMKILKELREDMNSNADTLRKELEHIRRSWQALEPAIF